MIIHSEQIHKVVAKMDNNIFFRIVSSYIVIMIQKTTKAFPIKFSKGIENLYSNKSAKIRMINQKTLFLKVDSGFGTINISMYSLFIIREIQPNEKANSKLIIE